MSKKEIGQLRNLVYEALKSTKTYMDFGGDRTDIKILAAFFKWPDVIMSLFEYMENKEGALEQCVSDIGTIAIQPLKILIEALIERHKIDKDKKVRYARVLAAPVDLADMAQIIGARKVYGDILLQILEEVSSNENPNSGSGQ